MKNYRDQFRELYQTSIDCCKLLKSEHEATLADLSLIEAGLETGVKWSEIEPVVSRLTTELKPHYQCEERGLFPVLSRYKTMILLEVEHDELLEFESDVVKAARHQSPENAATEAFKTVFKQLAEGLRGHIRQENEQIFPLAQKLLEPEEHLLVARRCAEIREELDRSRVAELDRPTPEFALLEPNLFDKKPRPIRLDKIWEREHGSAHHIELQAGRGFKKHWAGQHQLLICLSGEAEFKPESGAVTVMKPGHCIGLDSRYPFELTAIEQSHLISVKIWPRPHFTEPEQQK